MLVEMFSNDSAAEIVDSLDGPSADSSKTDWTGLCNRSASCGSQGSAPPGGGDSAPPEPPPNDPSRDRDRDVATKERAKSARPPRFKVLLYNDDYTPMEFVVQVLEKIFAKGPSAATQIMLQIHRSGIGIAGVFVLEVAETKSAAVHRMAEERGYPLRTGVEKE
jgi:ATP-dependent Clp protease adaptor protein ClpS